MISRSYPTLRKFFRECYKPIRLRGRSTDASRLHEVTLNNFARYLMREPVIEDLESDVIACFLAWMRERGRAAITANDNLNRLMALARFAVKKRLLNEEPDVEPEIEPERVVRAWLTADLEKLFAACATQPGTICGMPASAWWLSLHLVCLFTGERIRAVLSMRWDQIDFESGWLALTAEQRKGSKQDKEWPLPEAVVVSLRRLRGQSTSKVVFDRDFCLGTVYNRYEKMLINAGLPHDRNSKFHRIRKSTASHFAAAGGNATELLGHSSARVTKKYLDKRIVRDVSAKDLLAVPEAASIFLRNGRPDRLREPQA